MNVRLKLVSLALIAALGAGAAEAQGRYDRYGYHAPKESKVDVQQSGRANGVANTGMINQTGTANDARIRQYGKNNDASVTQVGDNNLGCVVQVGKNLSAGVIQEGNGLSGGVVQTNKGAYAIPGRMCSLDPANRGYWNRIGVKGY